MPLPTRFSADMESASASYDEGDPSFKAFSSSSMRVSGPLLLMEPRDLSGIGPYILKSSLVTMLGLSLSSSSAFTLIKTSSKVVIEMP